MYARAAKHLGTFLARMVSFFTEDPRFRGAIRLNQFTQTIEVPQPFPPRPGQVFIYRALREVDVLEALLIVQADGFAKATLSDVWRALILTAEHQGYHPVRDYLNGLVWDGTARIHRLFFDYFPGKLPDKDQPQSWWDKWAAYYEAIGQCFMISAVARIFEPGCKVDNMVIFESAQGYLKALALQALVGKPAWFTDDVPVDVVDKDAKDALVGKWIAELSETPHLRRDMDRFKAFVSRMTDRFRRAYERLTQDWPRQCVLVGTRNELVYLDLTGNRRFWGVPLAAPVNVDLIKRDRDQLWAEAVHLYKNKTPWWLSEELEKIAAEIQGGYVDDDALDGPIGDWIETQRDAKTKKVAPFEMSALYPTLAPVLGIGSSLGFGAGPPVPLKTDQTRIAASLKRLGFRREQRWLTGKNRKVWVETKKCVELSAPAKGG
jgi:predicted P-loop ATPase